MAILFSSSLLSLFYFLFLLVLRPVGVPQQRQRHARSRPAGPLPRTYLEMVAPASPGSHRDNQTEQQQDLVSLVTTSHRASRDGRTDAVPVLDERLGQPQQVQAQLLGALVERGHVARAQGTDKDIGPRRRHDGGFDEGGLVGTRILGRPK